MARALAAGGARPRPHQSEPDGRRRRRRRRGRRGRPRLARGGGRPARRGPCAADAGGRARGATLYCTLEPCCSHRAHRPVRAASGRGRHPPGRRSRSRIPIRSWPGRGLAYLRAARHRVAVGVLREAAERLNAPFFSVMRRGRPFVTMKVALSRDGFVAGAGGAGGADRPCGQPLHPARAGRSRRDRGRLGHDRSPTTRC